MNAFTFVCMFSAVICAFMSQNKRISVCGENAERDTICKKSWYILSYLLLAIPCFICTSGNDTPFYTYGFETWTMRDLVDLSIEPGYKLLNVFLNIFITEGYIGIGVIKLLSIYLIYKSIYLVRGKVSVGVSILAYCCLLYIGNFQLLRMMLAVGIAFLAMSYEVIGNKKKAIALLCLAPFFHYTAFFLIITYVAYIILNKKITGFRIGIITTVLLLINLFSSQVVNYLVNNLVIFNKYISYTRQETAYIGIGQIILFIPVIWLLLSYYKEERKQSDYCLSFLLGIMTFFVGTMGYIFPTITRANYYFYFFFIYYVSKISRKGIGKILLMANGRTLSFQNMIIVVYLVGVFLSYISAGSIATAGLDDVSYIWNAF